MKMDASTQCNPGQTILEKRHISTRATVANRGNLQYDFHESDGRVLRLTAVVIIVATFAYVAFSILSKAQTFKLIGA